MEFITVPNCRLGDDHPYPETISLNTIVSICEGRINLSNGQHIIIKKGTYKEIREYLTKKGYSITRFGD